MALYRNIIGATLFPELKGEAGTFTAPIGKARGIHSANYKLSRISFYSLRLPIGGERIAGPIVFALHKGNERIGKVWTTIRSA
jgi:hypothetical protein